MTSLAEKYKAELFEWIDTHLGASYEDYLNFRDELRCKYGWLHLSRTSIEKKELEASNK